MISGKEKEMYLKSLELQGFKSFPDKIKLTFDKGITGVVGPNGSGKSNIGDAMRWVLGEQSTKNLRGNKMEDVIFAGTASRKPVGFASVTLTIDNSKHEFNVDGDEVSVMRKLYRSGESEYRINGKSVRLKDINELFMDTGLGRDGYSIIGQGRIAEIVAAKSNERRDIFEEAAGISKFRYKKAEAERKLIQTDDNLSRLNDIVSELESRIEPLKIQSEKAKKFIELAGRRKNLEISVWINRLFELRKSLESADEKILICKSQYESAERDMESFEIKRKKCGQIIQQCSEKAESLRHEILEAEKKSSEYKSGIAVCENDILYCKKNNVALIEKQTALIMEKDKTAEKLEISVSKKSELEKLSSDISEKLEGIKNEFAETDKEYESIGKISDEKISAINPLYVKQSEYRLTVTSSESIISEINAQIDNISQQTSGYEQLHKKYINEQNETAESIRQLSQLEKDYRDKINIMSSQADDKKRIIDDYNKAYNRLILDINSVQQKVKIMQELENSMEGFSFSVKEIIKASKNNQLKGVNGTVAQLIIVENMYSTAVETALGGALQNIIVDNEQSAKECIQFLKQHRAGRSTFLPVTSVKGNELDEKNLRNEYGFIALGSEIVSADIKYRGIIKNLLGRTVIAQDIDCAGNIAKKYGYKFRIVTIDGQVVNAGGSFTGGSQVRSAGVLTRKNEIDKLNAKLSELEKQKSEYEKNIQQVNSQLYEINSGKENFQQELNQILSDKTGFEAEYKRLVSVSEQAEIQFRNSENSLLQLKKRLENQTLSFDTAVRELEKINSQIDEAEGSIASENSRKEDIRKKRENLSSQLSEMRIKEAEIRKDIESVDYEINSFTETVEKSESENKKILEDIRNQHKIISEKESEIKNLKKSLEKIKSDTEEISSQIENQHKIQAEQESLRDKINADIKSLNDTKENLTKELTRLEERRTVLLKENDSIVSQIWENYEMTRSEAEDIAVPVENIINANRELNEIRSRIKNLGNVNVDAIDEYKEVSERYSFMNNQLEDVRNSKAELEKLIDTLTVDMRQMFTDCFGKINLNFQHIFRELFGGGNAELVLTEPDDVLTSGIDIIVAPPGKVIKNLISLSGGEQSFIAIALYFAILKIRPAPFCILDEIDAALDDVNVSKYASYLKHFTDYTQFITVTHRRGTMECANILYGVTMQENGVSKLLRLDNSNPDAGSIS